MVSLDEVHEEHALGRADVPFSEPQRHGSLHRNHVVMSHRANKLVRGPGLQVIFVGQSAHHIGSGELQGTIQRTLEFGLCADTDDRVAGLNAGTRESGVLLQLN